MVHRFGSRSWQDGSGQCEIGGAISRAGHQVEVFTIRWEKSWPRFFKFQELSVHRLSRPLSGPWGGFRYSKSLSRELGVFQPDGIIVFGLGDEAWTISKAFGQSVPVAIRIDGHVLGPQSGKPNLSNRQLSAIKSARQLIVDSQWTADRLGLHGIAAEKIVIAKDPVFSNPTDHQPTNSKASARVAISDAHPVLMLEADQPLVITGAPMNQDDGVVDLVSAWPRVMQRFPKARLWILGEGNHSRRVWDLIVEKSMVHAVIMPGNFDELRDVFQAADAYVHPLRSNQSCSFFNAALASGCCCIATQPGTTEANIESNVNGIVVPPGNPNAMAEAITHTLSDESLRERLGQNAAEAFPDTTQYADLQHFIHPFVKKSDQIVPQK